MMVLVSLLFCLIGLAGTFVIVTIPFPPHAVPVLWSLLFPLVATLAYGRKAAVFAACSVAFFPVLLFPQYGWGNIVNVGSFVLWFLLHGWAADRRNAGSTSVLLNLYLVQIFHTALAAILIFGLIPLLVSFNPPFWYPKAVSSISTDQLINQTFRGLFNSFILVTIADSILRLPRARRFFGLNGLHNYRMNSLLLFVAVVVGFSFWLLFALFSANLLGEPSASAFVFQDPHEGLGLVLFLGGALFSGNLFCRFTERRLAMEAALKENEEKIRKASEDKDLLFRELQHRVKNNLAMIESLLSLQSMRNENPVIKTALSDAKSRVGSLTLIYDHLYRSQDLRTVDLKVYLESLVAAIRTAYSHLQHITIETRIDEVLTDLKHAVPVGFILNELLTNAIKHAYPEGREGVVRIDLKKGKAIVFTVADNGVGLPEAYLDGKEGSLGIVLVRSLAEQLKAELDILRDAGTSIQLSIPSSLLELAASS